MVKNTIGGKHHKKQKKGTGNSEIDNVRDFPWADNEKTFFGIVTTLFGGNLVEVKIDENVHKVRIPGSFRKKVWIGKGDLVLVHFDTDCKVHEIIFVYRPVEVQSIKSTGIFKNNEEDNEDLLFGNNESDDIDVSQI